MATTPQPAAFGSTPWGKDWIRRVEPIAVTRPNPMLPRARSLVRNDAVAVDHNKVGEFRCVVSAGKKSETAVLSLPRYSATERKSVLRILARHARGGATSGDLPDEVHAELTASKLSPVPDATETSCTCSGRIDPCLHVSRYLCHRSDRRSDADVGIGRPWSRPVGYIWAGGLSSTLDADRDCRHHSVLRLT